MPLENLVADAGLLRASPGACRDPETAHTSTLIKKALV
jgi:hypothetical protein